MLLRLLIMILMMTPIIGDVHGGLIDNIQNYFMGKKSHPPVIRVLIVNDKPGVNLEVRGKYRLYDPNTSEHISTRYIGKKNIFQAQSNGLRWGEEFPDVHQILIAPENLSVPVLIDGKEYRGKFIVYDIGGSVSVINELEVEDYIASLLTPQFPEAIPHEALAAVVITTRTNSLYQTKNPKNPFWDVDATSVEFSGYTARNPNSDVNHAVNETTFMVMNRPGTNESEIDPFPAAWGSSTGGMSQNSRTVFSHITLFDAEMLAEDGHDAKDILNKAFPGSQIVLTN